MENILKLTIITPERQFYSGDIVEINTQNDFGKFEILPNHVAMISSLLPTTTTFVEKGGKKLKAFTSQGILNVKNNEIKMMCDVCEWPDEIDLKRAEDAKRRAEERIKSNEKIDLKRAEAALKRAVARINSAKN